MIDPDDRAWLLRLCTRLSRDRDVAEDLAREALIEAWRHVDRLRDPDQMKPWLAGFARNVYLRWSRQRAREAAHMLLPKPRQSDGGLIEHQGVPAIVVSFQDMESPARLDVISSLVSFETLGIHHVHAS